MKTLLSKLGLLGGLIIVLAFIPKADDPISKITAALQQWLDTNPQEKVYLHTDKPYYLVGDTIWFKAYVTSGPNHQLSGISGALYVDLINEGDSLTKELKLPITSGMTMGNFVLGDSLVHEGNYRIRAYTNWMRNAGPDYFYDRTFTIGNSLSNTVFAKIDYTYGKSGSDKTKITTILKYTNEQGVPYADRQVNYQFKKGYEVVAIGGGKTNDKGELTVGLPSTKLSELAHAYLFTKIKLPGDETVAKSFPIKAAAVQTDVQFFPEGGYLVNGIKSKVAFKATATNGLGATITGNITDNTGKEVAQLTVKHLGMGYFYLTPEAGKTYQAKVTYPDGSVNAIELPAAVNDGYVLAVEQTAHHDSVVVHISAGQAKSGDVNLVGQSAGKIYFSAHIPVNGSSAVFRSALTDVPSGILQFTLFSASGDPLNERITFMQKNDNMNLSISSAKNVYNRREKIDLLVAAKDGLNRPVNGNFSVAVMSEAAVPSDENNENSIFSQLLLSSDIKGYIEKPNYYFNKINSDTRDNLDVLMLTQGYRRFSWKNILTGNTAAPTFKAEKLLSEITGTVSTFGKKPVQQGKVLVVNNKTGFARDTVTDNEGRFTFQKMLFTHGIEFTVQGATANGGHHIVTKVDEITTPDVAPNKNIGDVNADIPELVKASVANNLKQDLDLEKHGIQSKMQLREVKIRAARKPHFGGGITENEADEVFRVDKRNPCASLMDCLMQVYKTHIRFKLKTAECGPVWIPGSSIANFVVVIDKMLIADPCDYQNILTDPPKDIEKVYLVYESAAIEAKALGPAIMGQLGGAPSPAIIITTRSGNFRYTQSPSLVYYAPKGYDYVKEFYSPKYDHTNPPAADLRSTIYWNPRVQTRTSGQATVSYYNSDQTGSYRVIIEGINAQGLLARQVYRYTVE